MRVRILPALEDSPRGPQYQSAYLVGTDLAIDAGCAALCDHRVQHIFLTHSHSDHVAALPVYLEHVSSALGAPVTVYGSEATIDALSTHIFNDAIWPDITSLPSAERPYARFVVLEPEVPVQLEAVRVVPVPVDHVVPTFGYLVSDGRASVAFGADSGPTERLWKLAAADPKLRAVFLEASFPDSEHALARVSKHLTPALVAGEVQKLPAATRIVAVHLKPRYRAEIERQLAELGLEQLEIGQTGEYLF